MKKILAALVLAFSLTGVYVSADGRELPRQQGVQEMSVYNGSLNSLVLQTGRRRRRWMRNNNGNNNGNWNRRRWNRRRNDDNWHRRGRGRRGRRGYDHNGDHN
jgi:hypothetical protein